MHILDDSPSPSIGPGPTAGVAPAAFIYEQFYGLREKPFSLSADPRFWFRSLGHGAAFDDLHTGIRRREGLIVLTGEIGTGKTTLCRSVLQQLDGRTFAAFVADPFVSREDLLKTLLVDFGVVSMGDLTRGRFAGATRSDLSYLLYEFLDSLVPLQAFAVLIIDEAQHLSLGLLEEIRILSELERREKLLQVVLVGQPELRASLKLPQMRQVDHRVSVRCELMPLDAAGVAAYVQHRIDVAGRGAARLEFNTAALDAVFRGSAGVPRLINRICDRALQRSHAAGSRSIDARYVWQAIDDLGLDVARPAAVPSISPATVEPRAAAAPVPDVRPAHPAVDELRPRADVSVAPTPPMPRSDVPIAEVAARSGGWWIGAALASAIVGAVATGYVLYLHRQTTDAFAVAAALHPVPPPASFTPTTVPPRVTEKPTEVGADPGPAAADASVAAPPSTAAPGSSPSGVVSPPATAPGASTSASVGAAPNVDEGQFSILVASFRSRERAEYVVAELNGAGYRARAVEHDWGPPRGRLVHVSVGGYASAIDVERDLRRIRDLPGGYRDAHIVDRQ
jgi:general secretion pathway protein A